MRTKVRVHVNQEVDLQLPHYYVQHIDGDGYHCVIYGRITDTDITTINKNSHTKWEVEVETTTAARLSKMYSYFIGAEYQSCKEEFDKALAEFKEFVGML